MTNIEALLEHEPFIRRYAQSLVHGAPEADDVVQETWLAALRRPPRAAESPRGWLAVVARNALRGLRRAGARRAAREATVAKGGVAPSAAEVRAREDARRAAVLALLELEPIYRDVLILRYFEDLPPREIAARLDLGAEAVKTRLRRGLEQLRSRLDAEHEGGRRAWAIPLLPLASPPSPPPATRGPGVPAGRRPWPVLAPLLATAVAVVGGLLLLAGGSGDARRDAPPSRPETVVADADAGKAEPAAAPTSPPKTVSLEKFADGLERLVAGLTGSGPRGGIVVDGDGHPVAGARVAVVREPGYLDIMDRGPTGPDGRFGISTGKKDTALVAWVEGKLSSPAVKLDRSPRDLVLRVGPAGTVRGRVTDPTAGGKTARARVTLRLGWGPFAPEWETETDEQGRYEFEGVPWDVPVFPRVETSRRAVALPPKAPEPQSASESDEAIRDGAGATLDARHPEFEKDLLARINSGVEAEFTFLLPPGTPAPEKVEVTHAWITEYTWKGRTSRTSYRWSRDEDYAKPARRFLPAGPNHLSFTAPGLYAVLPTVEVEGNGPPRNVAVQFRRRTHVALRLVDGDGRPLAREGIPLTIWIADSSGGHGSGYKTDARGRLDVTDLLPPPGSRPGYDLAVTMRAEGFFRSDLDLPNLRVPLAKLDERLAAGDPVTLSVPATSTRAVRFRVVDRGGRPVAGVRVRCESGSGTFGTEEVTSGADGFATVELRAAPRSYDDHLVALPPYHGKCRFEIRRGAETPPPLVVEASEAATILLLDETGAPIADTPVAVGNEAGRTGPGGDLHLDLPRSGWVYWIRVEGFLPATARLTGSPRRATVRLERSRSLEVVVTAPNGEIEKGTLYFLREGGEEGVPAWLTFREGRARWSGQTARGELRIRAFAGRDAWTATGIAHPGEDRVELELAPARMGELALRVRSADGKALPGAAVSITTSPGRIYRQATTDDAGLARFPLPVGEYRIRPQIGSRIPDRLSFPVEVPTGEPIVLTALATEPRTVRIEFPEGSRAGRSYQIRLVGPDGSTFALAAGKLPPDGGPVERQLLLPVGRFTLRVELDGRREEWSWRGTPGAPPPFVFD